MHGEIRNTCKYGCTVSVRKPERNRPFGHLEVDGRIILKWILKNYGTRIYSPNSAGGRLRVPQEAVNCVNR
jgi:hypothetical protein